MEKCIEIGNKFNSTFKKKFNCEPVYNEKYLKTKIKSHERKINTNFHNDQIPNKSSHRICLSVNWLILFLEWVKTIIFKWC